MDPESVKSTLSNLNLGNVMAAAARDYQKVDIDLQILSVHYAYGDRVEVPWLRDVMIVVGLWLREVLAQGKGNASSSVNQEVDLDDLMDDPELEKLHADRIAALKKEAEKRQSLKKQGHGEYRDITEGDFLGEVTASEKVICHFYHREFYRCKIMDKHLKSLAPRHIETKFIRLDAENAPFFVAKLGIKTLPCVILFRKGIAADRLIGFQDLGGKDDFSTKALEVVLLKKGKFPGSGSSRVANLDCIISEKKREEEENVYDESRRRTVRSSVDPDSDSE
ncbi:hypothetical protein LguiB_033090 [Lonicera macranthoides]